MARCLPGGIDGRVLQRPQSVVEHLLDQGGLPRAAHSRDADQPVQRDVHVDVLEVVLRGAEDPDAPVPPRRGFVPFPAASRGDPTSLLLPGQVLRREGTLCSRSSSGRPPENTILPPCSPGSRAHVDHQVGRADHVGVMLHDDDRVAAVAQPLEDADEPPDVAGMQPDARLVQDEKRVHQGRPQRRGQVDPLHLPAAQRPGLAVQREVAEAHVHQVADAGADLAQGEPRWPHPAAPGRASASKKARHSSMGRSITSWMESFSSPIFQRSASGFRRAPPQAGQGW